HLDRRPNGTIGWQAWPGRRLAASGITRGRLMDLENRQETGSEREIVFDNAATAAGRGSGAADDLVSRLSAARLLAILRLEDPETAGVELARRLHSQGIRAIECTLNRSGALAAIERIQDEF